MPDTTDFEDVEAAVDFAYDGIERKAGTIFPCHIDYVGALTALGRIRKVVRAKPEKRDGYNRKDMRATEKKVVETEE
jgi:hypothetical protein